MDVRKRETFNADNRLPGLCTGCNLPQRSRKGQKEPIFLTDIFIEMEGEIQFCETCLKEIAKVIGYVDPALIEKLEADLKASELKNEELKGRVSEQTSAIQALMREFSSVDA